MNITMSRSAYLWRGLLLPFLGGFGVRGLVDRPPSWRAWATWEIPVLLLAVAVVIVALQKLLRRSQVPHN